MDQVARETYKYVEEARQDVIDAQEKLDHLVRHLGHLYNNHLPLPNYFPLSGSFYNQNYLKTISRIEETKQVIRALKTIQKSAEDFATERMNFYIRLSEDMSAQVEHLKQVQALQQSQAIAGRRNQKAQELLHQLAEKRHKKRERRRLFDQQNLFHRRALECIHKLQEENVQLKKLLAGKPPLPTLNTNDPTVSYIKTLCQNTG